jgi:hypothetical protein
MVYIRKVELERARRQVETYRGFLEGLRRLRVLGQEILDALQALKESADVFDSK